MYLVQQQDGRDRRSQAQFMKAQYGTTYLELNVEENTEETRHDNGTVGAAGMGVASSSDSDRGA